MADPTHLLRSATTGALLRNPALAEKPLLRSIIDAPAGDVIYAGGNFIRTLGVERYFAYFAGVDWVFPAPSPNAEVRALCAHAGEIWAYGPNITSPFQRLGRWNGAGWVNMAWPTANISSMFTDAGQLYLTLNTGSSGGVLRWDGGSSFTSLGVTAGGGFNAATFLGTDLFAGGTAASVNGFGPSKVYKRSGSTWSEAMASALTTAPVNCMALYNGQIHIGTGGGFGLWKVTPAPPVTYGNTFINVPIVVMRAHDGLLFYGSENSGMYHGWWNGSTNVRFTASNGGVSRPVRSLTVADGQLIIGGDFPTIGGSAVRHVARRVGSGYQQIGPTGLGDNTNMTSVYALTTL